MGYCLICDEDFTDIDKHIDKKHTPIKIDRGNDGDKLCPLCNVRVANMQRHYCSQQHRANVPRDAVKIEYGSEDYKIHFDKYCDEKTVNALKKEETENDDPFWTAAKSDLSENDYKKLKEYADGRKGELATNGHTRIVRRPRFSRSIKNIGTNSKRPYTR